MTRIFACFLAIFATLFLTTLGNAQSALYPGWATDKTWIAKNDEPFLPIRKECDSARKANSGFNLQSPWPTKADTAIADWRREKTSPMKLYRASSYLSLARRISYKYCFDFGGSKDVRDLVDAWMKMPSQKSYEFARYGYIFVNAFNTDALSRLDLVDRLFARNTNDEGLQLAWIHYSYDNSGKTEDAARAIKYAEGIYKVHPKELYAIGSLIVAYNDGWLADNKRIDYLEKAIKYTKMRQAMIPKDHPLYGKEAESIKMYRAWIKEYGPKKK